MKVLLQKILFVVCGFTASHLVADTAFFTGYLNSTIYSFDTNNVSTPATAYMAPSNPDNIAFSPDGNTVYFTTDTGGDVYSFPTNNPSDMTALNTGIPHPVGIAISSDGTLGFSADDQTPGIYSFPTGGVTHPATLLTATGTTIATPLFIVISGANAFVGDFENGQVYSVIFTSTTYNATLIQSFGDANVGGLAISSDGFLYISNGFNSMEGMMGQISRVPLSSPTDTPTVVAITPTNTDGIALSNDGTTLYYTYIFGSNAVYSIPITGSFPETVIPLIGLNAMQAIDIAIVPSSISAPTNLTGSQKKNDFALIYERFNLLEWNPSPTTGVAGYNVYRNGDRIAVVNATTFFYKDHDIPKGATNTYSVSAFDSSGNESSQTNTVVIN